MQTVDISLLTTQVLWATFALAMVFGAIAQQSHFCTMGAVSDIITMGDWTRMRQWALAVGVGMVGFGVMVFAGWIDPGKTLYSSTRWLWLSGLLGGTLFGFGMVLASGCGSKTLVRIGGGSLKSLAVFVVMGVAGFATLKGITAVARVATVDRVSIEFAGGASLPAWLVSATNWPLATASLVVALLIGGGLVVWALLGRDFVRPVNLLAGLGIGGVLVALWWVSGHLGYVAEHPETLQETFVATNSTRAEALSFVAPVAYVLDWLMFFSDRSKQLTVGIVAVFGVVAGSAVVAVVTRRFRWEGFGGVEDVANHLGGAVLMGIGGVTAMGCTIGQGLSGLSTLSATSFTAVIGIMVGAVLAFRYQFWRLEQAV